MKIAGVGFNLTEANNIIITEPCFNPSAEDQAI
jgi:SNF2 family DNA or RNA helicase